MHGLTVTCEQWVAMSFGARKALVDWLIGNQIARGSRGVTAITLLDESGRQVSAERITADPDSGRVVFTDDDDGERRWHRHKIVFTTRDPFPLAVLAEMRPQP